MVYKLGFTETENLSKDVFKSNKQAKEWQKIFVIY